MHYAELLVCSHGMVTAGRQWLNAYEVRHAHITTCSPDALYVYTTQVDSSMLILRCKLEHEFEFDMWTLIM